MMFHLHIRAFFARKFPIQKNRYMAIVPVPVRVRDGARRDPLAVGGARRAAAACVCGLRRSAPSERVLCARCEARAAADRARRMPALPAAPRPTAGRARSTRRGPARRRDRAGVARAAGLGLDPRVQVSAARAARARPRPARRGRRARGARRAARAGAAPELVVPVPLHPRRLRARGFNPALAVARAVGRAIAAPVAPTALERLRDTPSQTGLDARRAPAQPARRHARAAHRARARLARRRRDHDGRHVARGSARAARGGCAQRRGALRPRARRSD